MKKITSYLIIAILFASCEKEISIDLNSADPQLVIEGNITDQAGPYFVRISKTVNFSDGNNFPAVSGASVVITDDLGFSETLTETSPGLYQTSSMVGQELRTYNLKVNVEGKDYFATSRMAEKVNLDSIVFTPFSAPGSIGNFSTIPIFTDPAYLGNNYRFILTVNGVIDNTYFIVNDNATNGTVNQRPIFSPTTEIKLGDSVKIEMRCIDLKTYDYFYTISQIAGGGPGGGTTPSNPPNNITGEKALGYFSAHTVQYIIKEVTE